MLQMKAEGKTYTEIDDFFGITGSGARENVCVAARLLQRHGADAFPSGTKSDYPIEVLISSVPNLGALPVPVPAEKRTVPPQKLRVPTPLGDIVVSSKMDGEYPGVYIDLKGLQVNDKFGEKEGVAYLASIEFDPNKGKIQSVIYGNGNSEEFTHLIEHENLTKAKAKPPLSEIIQKVSSRVEHSMEQLRAPDHERE